MKLVELSANGKHVRLRLDSDGKGEAFTVLDDEDARQAAHDLAHIARQSDPNATPQDAVAPVSASLTRKGDLTIVSNYPTDMSQGEKRVPIFLPPDAALALSDLILGLISAPGAQKERDERDDGKGSSG